MDNLPAIKDYEKIVLNQIPLIDVRSAVEFNKGAFPDTVNLPLLDDEERHIIGIEYKEKGKEKAIELGYKTVSGLKKEERVNAWVSFIKKNPDAVLYCFRGGKRSQISQQWISDAGIIIPRLTSGYKGFRNYLLDKLENPQWIPELYIIGGRTGSGKTNLLRGRNDFIDIEKLTNHLGSSFGRQIQDQPTQIQYENDLAYDLIRKTAFGSSFLLLEDEGKNTGRLYLPEPFYKKTAESKLLVLETPLEERVSIVWDEYVKNRQASFINHYNETGLDQWADSITQSIDRIQKRLGVLRHKELKSLFKDAFVWQIEKDEIEAHRKWIHFLLKEYYDPMYDYQLLKKEDRIIFRGNSEELLGYISALS